jgi:hypothetical protein
MVFAFTPLTRPSPRRLTICRYCQPALGRFLVGGAVLFPYTLRHLSPHLHHRLVVSTPSIGDQWWRRMWVSSTLYNRSNASRAASVSLLAIPRAARNRRVSLSISVQRQNPPECALSGVHPFHRTISKVNFSKRSDVELHPDEGGVVEEEPHQRVQTGVLSASGNRA